MCTVKSWYLFSQLGWIKNLLRLFILAISFCFAVVRADEFDGKFYDAGLNKWLPCKKAMTELDKGYCKNNGYTEESQSSNVYPEDLLNDEYNVSYNGKKCELGKDIKGYAFIRVIKKVQGFEICKAYTSDIKAYVHKVIFIECSSPGEQIYVLTKGLSACNIFKQKQVGCGSDINCTITKAMKPLKELAQDDPFPKEQQAMKEELAEHDRQEEERQRKILELQQQIYDTQRTQMLMDMSDRMNKAFTGRK